MIKPTKYYSSLMLRFDSVDRFLYRFADRDEFNLIEGNLVERVRKCMIYFICCRPIVSIVPETFKKEGEIYTFDITYRIRGLERRCKLKSPVGLFRNYGGNVEVSGYPYKSVYFYNSQGNLAEDFLISNSIHLFDGVPDEISNLEILYIGKGTADCAVDRLDGHSTLERILADILKNEPSNEVALLLYNFEFHKDAMSNPNISVQAEIRGEVAKKHFEEALGYKPNIDEQTGIVEAVLIDYFKTKKYNLHFTQELSLSLKTLKNVNGFDFDGIIVRVNNENIGNLKIFSNMVPSSFDHLVVFDIRKREGRASVFD